ncbi:hypothetical protein BGZ96_012368 [Linnemannia gamsii]|uniref:Ion transport domain-containing protein n=1 Tax=Linnemannia gamsii TaxID=64522 RepID=A0ABQ7KCG8_9FUNG|nr:hypothetical protein BGZ96_012368 [Linnemannia gamsii]
MADCIVNISEDSVDAILQSQPLLSTELQAPSTAVSLSASTKASSELTATPLPPKAYRWYLQDSGDESFPTERTFALAEEFHPPIKIDASKKTIKWKIDLPSDREKGEFYDIVLGVSTKNLRVDDIESILMRIEQSRKNYEGFECEVFKRHELERLSATDELNEGKDKDEDNDDGKEARENKTEKDNTVFKWKLFHRCYGIGDEVSFIMEINTWPELPLEYGSLDLHFVELCTDSLALYQAGDGRFAVINTAMGDDDEFIEVWDLQDYEIESKKADDPMDKGSPVDDGVTEGVEEVVVKRHRATPVAWMPLATGNTLFSISWDGSLVVVMDRKKPESPEDGKDDPSEVYQSLFAVYQCSRDDKGTSETPPSRMSLVRYDVEQTCPGLRNYVGDGVFHMVDKLNPDPKDELFVACNGITIEIYSTFEQWTPLRSIVMDSTLARQNQPFDMGSAMFRQLQGRYLITTNDTEGFTYDIMQGTLISFSTAVPEAYVCTMNYLSTVSPDGLLIAISGYRHVSVYRTQTWTLQGTYVFDEIASDERVERAIFMDDGNLLHVMVGQIENVRWQGRPGYILDVATMTVVGRVAADGTDTIRLSPLDESVQGIVYSGYTKLWHMRLEDRRTLRSPTGDTDRCTDRCDHPDSLYSCVDEGTSPSGLHLKVQRVDASFGSDTKRKKRSTLTVTMTDPTNSQAKKMIFPLPRVYRLDKAAFFADFRYLLIMCEGAFFAWSVPTTFEGDFRLQMVLYAEGSNEWEWTICSHDIVRCRSEDEEKLSIIGYVKQSFTKSTEEAFLTGLGLMVLPFYELADVGLKQEIVRYYGRFINTYPYKDDVATSLMTIFSVFWSPDRHQVICEIIKGLLSLSGTRWVPHHNLKAENSPLTIFLDKAKTNSLANTGVQIIVDYCLREAKASQDPYFLVPILQCLPSLVDSNQLYSELARTIYRELAFFPVQGREFLIANHLLINPSTFRWRFWKTYPWGLHQYRDQVLQFSTDKTPNPPKGNFTRDIFQASFDLLWHGSQDAGSQQVTEEPEEVTTARTLFSWPHAIWTMISRKCRLKYNATVECYPFELETLDNPALMALVEYKWNTIGFHYWLVRFLGQVGYYIMVLTAMFLQIYVTPSSAEDDNGKIDLGLEGLFVAIIVVAFIFLWLEFVQLLKDKRGYIQSIYNWVDLLVFFLPLAGAINQMLIIQGVVVSGLNPGLLSFSVLFIFLHFLFELRVFQAVCHFVSMIIRAIYSIRVFFFVFAGGLFAFSIAIVHLMYACVSSGADHCDYFTEGFSHNLLRAISVSYFMMGGNYDPVEKGFETDSFAFHMMMIVFFFFTVILMMNVLIALINNAIDDGDQTWQLDWLEYRMRYVESAENMTYDIPGFREKHNFFPDTIYYTATPQQVRDYKKKTREMEDNSTPGVLDHEGDGQQLIESNAAAASVATVETVSPDVHAAVEEEKKGVVQRNETETMDEGLAHLMETKLRKHYESERASSQKQIGELQQQLRDQQEMMREQQQVLMQILSKLER